MVLIGILLKTENVMLKIFKEADKDGKIKLNMLSKRNKLFVLNFHQLLVLILQIIYKIKVRL